MYSNSYLSGHSHIRVCFDDKVKNFWCILSISVKTYVKILSTELTQAIGFRFVVRFLGEKKNFEVFSLFNIIFRSLNPLNQTLWVFNFGGWCCGLVIKIVAYWKGT